MYEIRIAATILSVIYPCFLGKLVRKLIGDDDLEGQYGDIILGQDQPPCSNVIDAIVFNPEVVTNSRTIVVSPEAYDLPFEIIQLASKDGTSLMGYLILQQNIDHDKVPTIIFYHGNSGNIGDRLSCAKKLFRDMKVNVFLIEYRGFGFSQGRATEQGVYLDAQAAFDYIYDRPDIDSKQIVIFGRSLGGAVVIDLATRKPYNDRIAAVVIENTFSTLTELTWHILPRFMMPLIKLFRLSSKFKNFDKITEITRPTLFISGMEDTFIPPPHMTKLYMACRARKRILRFHEGDHLNSWTIKGYTKAFRAFIDEVLQTYPVMELPQDIAQLRDNER